MFKSPSGEWSQNQRLFFQCLYLTLASTENNICSIDVREKLTEQQVSPAPGLNDHCFRCSRNVHNSLDPLAK